MALIDLTLNRPRGESPVSASLVGLAEDEFLGMSECAQDCFDCDCPDGDCDDN